jgi:hypothetical protein
MDQSTNIGTNTCHDPTEDWTENSENWFQNEGEDWDSGRIQSPENRFQANSVVLSLVQPTKPLTAGPNNLRYLQLIGSTSTPTNRLAHSPHLLLTRAL